MRKWLFIAILVLIGVPLTLVGTLLYTETGVTLIAGQLHRLERFGVRIQGVSGTLSGPLHVQRLELDNPHVHVVTHDITAQLRLRDLLVQTVRIESLSARDTLVEVRRASATPPSTKPLHFLPSFMRISARKVDLTGLRYVNIDGTVVEADHLQARARISPGTLRVSKFQVTAPQFQITGQGRMRARRPMTLELQASASYRLPNGTELLGSAQTNGDLEQLAIKANLQQPHQINVNALLALPRGGWRVTGQVTSPAIALDPWMQHPPVSLRNVALNIEAQPEHIAVAGNIGVPEIASRDLTVDLEGRFAGRVLHLESGEVAINGTATRLHASGTAQFDGEAPTLDVAARWTGLQWPIQPTAKAVVSSADGTLTLRGSLPYEYELEAHLTAPTVGSAETRASGLLDKERLTLRQFNVAALDGTVTGSGSVQFAQPRAWNLQAHAVGVNPVHVHPEFPGSVSVTLDAKGEGFDRLARFNAAIGSLSGTLRQQRLSGRGAVERDSKGWRARNVELGLGEARLSVDGTLLQDTLDARWSLHAASLQTLVPDAHGRVDFSGTARGPIQTPQLVANLQASELRYDTWRLDLLMLDGDVDLGGQNPSRLSVHARQAGKGEPSIDTLQITGAGVAQEHRIDIDVTGVKRPREPRQHAKFVILGHYDQAGLPESILPESIQTGPIQTESIRTDGVPADPAQADQAQPDPAEAAAIRQPAQRAARTRRTATPEPVWTGTLQATQLSPGRRTGEALAMPEPARFLVARSRAWLDKLCVTLGNGQFCATGRWQHNGPWEGTVSGYELPLAAMLPPAGEQAEYAGRIEGRVHASGAPGQPWQGEAGARIIDAAIIYKPLGAPPETLNLGNGGLAGTADANRLSFSLGVQAFADTFVYANAKIDRGGSNDLLHLPLVGDVRAKAADANILPIVFEDIDNAAGLLTANVDVSGTLAAPEINGRIELVNGAFDTYRVNLALRDLHLVADLASNGLNFKGEGRAGEGRLDMNGHLTWQDGVSRGTLQLKGENLLVADLPEYRVVASPDLQFLIDGRHMEATGNVTIPTARIQPVNLSGAVQASPDARYVGEHPAEQSGKFTLRSEIGIAMGADVRVDAFGLQGRIEGGVGTTVVTGEAPVGRGELRVEEGRYEAYGQKLDITRGRLLFDISPLDDPALDIEAQRKVEAVKVGMNVRGTLRSPRLSFFSDPSMPQTQIVSYLLVGKGMDSMQSGDAAAVGSARDSLALQGGGLIASQLGRRLGLSEVGVESSIESQGEKDASLVLGKFLSPRLFISYGISLTESINTLKLRYTVSDRWVLKMEAGANQSADAEYTIER